MKNDFRELTGLVISKDNSEYETSIECWNRAIKKYPLAIVFCNNNEDIINAIKWSKLNDIDVRIRSGRHHYEGYSTGNDVLVIDISKMNNITINEKDGVVIVQGGARNRELYKELNSRGYPFPGGGCPTVGVAGFTLGGGWGYSSRLFGLGCDSLIEVEMINANGEVLVANDSKNTDLLWALKGSGGGNYGVITSMKFKLPKKLEMATLINIDCPHSDIKEVVNLAKTYEKEFKTLDRKANFKLAMYNSKERGIGAKITGVFYGDKASALKIIQPFICSISNTNIELRYLSIDRVNEIIQDSHPDYEKYKSGGRFIFNDLTDKNFDDIIDILSNPAEGSVYTSITLYGLGGAIEDKESNDTAFFYRKAKFIIGFQTVWEEDSFAEVNRNWLMKNFKVIKDMTVGSFINFPISCIDNHEEEYYRNNYMRLREIKRKYDPQNNFKFEQSIRVK